MLQYGVAGALEKIRSHGASILAIWPQPANSGRKVIRDMRLSFPILTDHGGELAHAFGIRVRLTDKLLALYQGFGNDLGVTVTISEIERHPMRIGISAPSLVAVQRQAAWLRIQSAQYPAV